MTPNEDGLDKGDTDEDPFGANNGDEESEREGSSLGEVGGNPFGESLVDTKCNDAATTHVDKIMEAGEDDGD